MAARILNRRQLRKRAEVPLPGNGAAEAAPASSKKKPRIKAAAPKVRKPRKPKTPPRMRARWGVFDGSMKQVAIFDYSDRAGADEKLAGLLERKKGSYFLQIVKEVIVEPQPVEAVAIESS